ncbi:hypothetical protein BS50DRAFT_582858 [Corynespora cassiicola Philippines]|uniref:Uncharacterized protein n=1 Tax=Corynespora cassiicola Philippines TaxID=1448308 RepID=A0A2T2P7J9_CORCC|nr:hypothetical protein BS50DRAFT_582858 [Corynespora cassiicola Philippines]
MSSEDKPETGYNDQAAIVAMFRELCNDFRQIKDLIQLTTTCNLTVEIAVFQKPPGSRTHSDYIFGFDVFVVSRKSTHHKKNCVEHHAYGVQYLDENHVEWQILTHSISRTSVEKAVGYLYRHVHEHFVYVLEYRWMELKKREKIERGEESDDDENDDEEESDDDEESDD